MATSSKSTRECTRAPKCSILLSNVLGISLNSSSLEVADQNGTTNDPNKPQQYTGKSLFDSFIEENKSNLHSRLDESLSEIRFAGWIQPFTLLVKGPLEDLEVIKEAWRRRFLRSPRQFSIREIGTIKSVDTEIVQQAPFLPLTKAVYEAIAALNKNNLPSGQQNVFEYLAHTYQYVHVPKPNIIRDSLGILFKEGKVYSSGNNYFVLVDTQSEMSEDNKKEQKTTSVKEKKHEKHVRCEVYESTNHKTKSTHAQNGISKGTEHAHLCEKHKRGEKRINKKAGSSKDTNSPNTNKESKDLNSHKKENRSTGSPSSGNSSKMNEKTPKKTVWEQIACFIKGKHGGPTSETAQDQKAVDMNDKNVEPTKSKSTAAPIDKPGTMGNHVPKMETKVADEKKKALDSVNKSQNENTAQIQRSNSFTAHNKKRPSLVRSNTFTAGSSNRKHRPVDYDIITSRIDEQSTGISEPDHYLTRPLSREYAKKSSLAENARYFSTSDFVRQSKPVKDAEKNTSKNQPFSQKLDSFRLRNSSYEVREADKFPLRTNQISANLDSSRSNACAVGVVRPWSTHAQSTRSDSRPVSRTNSIKETSQFSLSASCTPTSDTNKPISRGNRHIKRSVSLNEKRNSDCTPLTLQRYAGSVNREFLIGDSPLSHLLIKNTGNTLPVSPSHPNYIPAKQDRSRNSTPNRNSFPSANNSWKRNSWREASLEECYDSHGYASSERTGFSYLDEKPKRHENVFSFDYTNKNHLSRGMVPCDCSDAGYSENYERRSASSDPYHLTSSSVHKDERSSIYSNSDYGILLDEVSSSGSSEIKSIMNQEKKLDDKAISPYTVAKGEVVLDSSLTFIGII